MITKKTVLILGAGASAPYGFPTGRSLLLQITDDLIPGTSTRLRQTLPFSLEHTNEFQAELLASHQPSVDAFIENRPSFTDIGKTAIAIKLINCENPDRLMRAGRLQWYEYLWNQLGTRRQEFLNSKLSVITFNYDRSLEYSLFNSLRSAFGLSVDEASQDLRDTIPIIHVYGQLGLPEFFDPDGRSYTTNADEPNVKKAVSGIEIVRESEAVPSERADEIDNLLSNAEVVCFLGFGYQKANVDRLHIEESFERGKLLGSAFGLSPDERGRAVGLFSRSIILGSAFDEILDYIRSSSIFE